MPRIGRFRAGVELQLLSGIIPVCMSASSGKSSFGKSWRRHSRGTTEGDLLPKRLTRASAVLQLLTGYHCVSLAQDPELSSMQLLGIDLQLHDEPHTLLTARVAVLYHTLLYFTP